MLVGLDHDREADVCLTCVYYDLRKESLHEGTALLRSLYMSGHIPVELLIAARIASSALTKVYLANTTDLRQGSSGQSVRLSLSSRTVAQSLTVEARAFGERSSFLVVLTVCGYIQPLLVSFIPHK